ncbi:uncharacterized protein [Euwallacea fornicatus]|uniref:uncharacterized protein n=1 Tax=Euwallacea fornicatus TaxID=995702 RepID=UPI00338F2472
MELKHVLLTILKIVISTWLVRQPVPYYAKGAILMGGHVDNQNYTEPTSYDEYDYSESTEISKKMDHSENIPHPSPLVLPGYNLPENIFNRGMPFYAEKDPLTGKVDLEHKSPTLKSDDDTNSYEYIDDDVPSDDIYDKKNIDRKDSSYGSSHKQADINQLTPNFHDFLNLPVKYNPNKYVYPLISSSYASTKIQGSVNKYHNHKDTFGVQKPTTAKRPAYYSTSTTAAYFTPRTTQRTMATTPVSTTTVTTKPTAVKRFPELTTPSMNILSSGMSHPSFTDEYEYVDEEVTIGTTKKSVIYLTTDRKPTEPTTTKRVMSLFEQLFGDYDETVTTTAATKPTVSQTTTATSKSPITTTQASYPNIHAGPIVEYSDDYSDENIQDNIPVENKVHLTKVDDLLSVEPLNPVTKLSPVNKTIFEEKGKTEKKPVNTKFFSVKPTNHYDTYQDKTTTTTSTTTPSPTTYKPTTTTTAVTATRVTSLPLGENHISAPSFNRDPIIVATQNLREKLNSEKVAQNAPPHLVVELPPRPQEHQRPQLVPSSSSIHIAPGQDTVSFVVGQHQSVGSAEGGQYVGTALKESPFDTKPFRPLYGHEATYTSNMDTNRAPLNVEAGGSAVTIQPMQNSEASVAIGTPVNRRNKVPGQVMDASLVDNQVQIHFPKPEGAKIVFPDEKKKVQSNLIPSRLEGPQQEVLKLNSKPMYHQLPSDLTPPKENDIGGVPPRYGPSMRPPWDPRPGHFYTGKPEYARPPRPHPEVAYKRIDNLPNILPQFRPNMKYHHPIGPPPPFHFDQRFNRQPLLERPSNRPIGFFEKMGPPHPNVYKRYPPKNILRGPPLEERRPNFDLEERRPLAQQPLQSLDEGQTPMAEDRIMNVDPRRPAMGNNVPELTMYQTPPNINVANRRHGDGDTEVETLQMIQAKNEKDVEGDKSVKVAAQDLDTNGNNSDKTIYKVYPVNTAPTIDVDKKEELVIGSKLDAPLPPSKIHENDFNYQQQDRNDAPVLKPHPRPSVFPGKSDFPYPLERPSGNKNQGMDINFNNQWNSVNEYSESRIVSGGKINYGSNQISATLKTYTEKPIAIAYTPTEPNLNADKYSMPNYGSPVIPEIRPGTVDNADTGYEAALRMPQMPLRRPVPQINHKIDLDADSVPPKLDFQAPFQASVKLDAATNQGWSVVRDKNKTTTPDETEVTTLPLATTSEFDIENFKPQLIGGFKPLYNLPDGDAKSEGEVADREE